MAVLDYKDRIKVLISMGNLFRSNKMNPVIEELSHQNSWFTIKNSKLAIKSWALALSEEKLLIWLKEYPQIAMNKKPLDIQVIMAGNLPMVGLHDLISVFISGHKLVAKLSSKDSLLMPRIINNLAINYPDIINHISFSSKLIDHPHALISTGSNQTISAIEEKYSGIPGIYRGNRNSIAILNGSENENDLDNLIFDIRAYFGFGCRNASLIFIPDKRDLEKLLKKISSTPMLQNHPGYRNSLKQQKAIFEMNDIPYIDAGDIIFTESRQLKANIGVIHYNVYQNTNEIKSFIKENSKKIQCVISNDHLITSALRFGESQFPQLWDYADNVDTLNFLLNLKDQ